MCESFFMLESTFTFSYIFTMHKCTNSTCMHISTVTSLHIHFIEIHLYSLSQFLTHFHTFHILLNAVDVFVNNFVTHRFVVVDIGIGCTICFYWPILFFSRHVILCQIFVTFDVYSSSLRTTN